MAVVRSWLANKEAAHERPICAGPTHEDSVLRRELAPAEARIIEPDGLERRSGAVRANAAQRDPFDGGIAYRADIQRSSGDEPREVVCVRKLLEKCANESKPWLATSRPFGARTHPSSLVVFQAFAAPSPTCNVRP